MKPIALIRAALAGLLAAVLLAAHGAAQVRPPVRPGPAPAPAAPKFVPKFEALAETRLLMEGLAHSNYRGLHKQLKDKPADVETWTFVRGQALLVAETGNLLLLRPPRNAGRDTWMKLAMDMRTAAGNLARHAAARDHARSKATLVELTNACNRCHQTFRVGARVGPDPGEKAAALKGR